MVVNIISVCEHIEIPDDVYSNTINCKYERSENRKEKVREKNQNSNGEITIARVFKIGKIPNEKERDQLYRQKPNVFMLIYQNKNTLSHIHMTLKWNELKATASTEPINRSAERKR